MKINLILFNNIRIELLSAIGNHYYGFARILGNYNEIFSFVALLFQGNKHKLEKLRIGLEFRILASLLHSMVYTLEYYIIATITLFIKNFPV